MANYRKDPNNSQSLVPGPLPDNAYDRVKKQPAGKFMKTPHYVYVAKTIPANDELSFYFKSSASFEPRANHLCSVAFHFFNLYEVSTVGLCSFHNINFETSLNAFFHAV